MIHKVIFEPFSINITNNIKLLINNNDLVCNTKQLPRYGVAIQHVNNKNILGYIGAHKKYGEVAHIDILVVESGTRDSGIGTQLIHEMSKLLIKNNLNVFTAEVEASNEKAIQLYIKLGAKLKMSFGLTMFTKEVVLNTKKLSNHYLNSFE